MKRRNFRRWIGAVYLLLICSVLGLVLYNYTELYGTVSVIEKREDTLRQKSYSIPVRVALQSRKLGSYTVLEEASIQKIWQSVHAITGAAGAAPAALYEAEEPRLSGTIYYLNGVQETFQIGRHFQWNQQVYYDADKRPLVHSLENDLLQLLYSRERVAELLLTAPQVRLYRDFGVPGYALSPTERQRLQQAVQAAESIQGQQRQVTLLTQANNPSVHVRIELTPAVRPEEMAAEDIINLDPYENGCIAVQYLGDANGRQIYFKADIMKALPMEPAAEEDPV